MSKNIIDVIIKADDKASAQIKSVAASTKSLGSAMSAAGTMIAAAGAVIVGSLTAIVMKTAEWGHDLSHMSERIGVSTEFISQMEYALKTTGGELGNFQIGMKLLAGAIYDAGNGSDTAQKKFKLVGISLNTSSGAAKSQTDVFFELADKIKNAATSTDQMAIATDFFGRNALMMVPMLKLGSAGIKQLMDKADALGGTLKGSTAESADAFAIAMIDVKTALRGVGLAIFEVYGDKLTKYSEQLATKTIPKTREWVKANEGIVEGVGKAGLGMGLLGVGMKVFAAAIANPAVATAIATIGAIIFALVNMQKDAAKQAAEWGKPIWGMTDAEIVSYANHIAGLGQNVNTLIADLKKLRDAGKPNSDAQEGIDLWGVQLPAALDKAGAASKTPVFDLEQPKMLDLTAKDVAASYSQWIGDARAQIVGLGSDTDDAINRIVHGMWRANGAMNREQATPLPEKTQEAQELLARFDVTGEGIATSMTETFGSVFSIIGEQGVRASEVFEQAWRSAISGLASSLAKMFVWRMGLSIFTGGAAAFAAGGEITKGARGFEVSGGSRGSDTVPALIAGGEAVIPSPTMDKLKRFLDGTGASAQSVIVNPLFFSGSRADANLAAVYIQRQLDSQDRFIIKGSL